MEPQPDAVCKKVANALGNWFGNFVHKWNHKEDPGTAATAVPQNSSQLVSTVTSPLMTVEELRRLRCQKFESKTNPTQPLLLNSDTKSENHDVEMKSENHDVEMNDAVNSVLPFPKIPCTQNQRWS